MFPRKITSLQEDMAKLGLSRLADQSINGKAKPSKPVTESKPAPKTTKQLAEAKKAVASQRQRAAKIRESRMAKKLAIYDTRLQRIERAAKKTGQKVEFKIRMVKGVQKRAAVMESYDVRKSLGGKEPTNKALAESFMKVASLAGTLARAFGVIEHFVAEAEGVLGLPVMHPGSEYGLEIDHSNAGGKSGSGDVIDYGSEKEDDETKPADNMDDDGDDDMNEDDGDKADDSDKDALVGLEDDQTTDDDDVQTEDDDEKEDDDVQTEDDEDAKDDDAVAEDDEKDDDDVQTEDDETPAADDETKAESRRRRSESRNLPMDYELHSIRLEAEDLAMQAVGSDPGLNKGYLATDLLNDMVSYLGGAMKLYGKLQQSMQAFKYVGQDKDLDQAGGTPTPTADKNDAYIGTVDKPEGETALGQGDGGVGEDETQVESKKPAAKKPAAKK